MGGCQACRHEHGYQVHFKLRLLFLPVDASHHQTWHLVPQNRQISPATTPNQPISSIVLLFSNFNLKQCLLPSERRNGPTTFALVAILPVHVLTPFSSIRSLPRSSHPRNLATLQCPRTPRNVPISHVRSSHCTPTRRRSKSKQPHIGTHTPTESHNVPLLPICPNTYVTTHPQC